MSRLILVTGGGRSGKSSHAQRLAEQLPAPRAYVATCPFIDGEMAERIATHRREREGRGWQTFEAPDDPGAAIRQAAACPVVLVDCLTLWINNLMFAAEQQAMELSEEIVAERCRDLMLAARNHGGTVIFVTNELGMGIVPDNAAARHFRDLAGRANQVTAAACDEVVFVVSGLPLTLKTT